MLILIYFLDFLAKNCIFASNMPAPLPVKTARSRGQFIFMYRTKTVY